MKYPTLAVIVIGVMVLIASIIFLTVTEIQRRSQSEDIHLIHTSLAGDKVFVRIVAINGLTVRVVWTENKQGEIISSSIN